MIQAVKPIISMLATMFSVSLYAGLVMFKALPRHQFGQLQSKLFPAYFLFTMVAQAIALVSNIMLTGRTAGREVYVQVAGLACTLLNLLAIGKYDMLCIRALAVC